MNTDTLHHIPLPPNLGGSIASTSSHAVPTNPTPKAPMLRIGMRSLRSLICGRFSMGDLLFWQQLLLLPVSKIKAYNFPVKANRKLIPAYCGLLLIICG